MHVNRFLGNFIFFIGIKNASRGHEERENERQRERERERERERGREKESVGDEGII